MQEVEFLKFIVENIVSNKEDISIDRTEDELWVLLTLKVNPSDMGVVIWKKWAIINSIRSLLKILWNKISKRINLKVVE